MTPQVAWCWASGLIEIGNTAPIDSPNGAGAILIATGPKYSLKNFIAIVARHGKGTCVGQLIVPGVPEASNAGEALQALINWLKWCSKTRSLKRDGITVNISAD